MMNEDLKKIRRLIDKIDKQIIESLNQRGVLAQKIKKAKSQSSNQNIFRPEREAQILRNIRDINSGPLPNDHLHVIFREIISSCLALETDLQVGCLGPEQSYSNIAAKKFFGSAVTMHFSDSIHEIFSNVQKGAVNYGIVPIENSNQGSIKLTLEHLIKDNVMICGEVNLVIKHCLLSKAKNLKSIKKLYAHEQTFLQCNDWLTKNIPNVKRLFSSSNSAAVKKIIKLKDSAAIASNSCSAHYDIPILKNNIHDNSDNTTRFIVIGDQNIGGSGNDKTSILISIDNKSGALNSLLEPLSKNKISMSKIESIPTKINNWEYMFLLDIEGHIDDKLVKESLKEIQKKSIFFKNLGSYPRSI